MAVRILLIAGCLAAAVAGVFLLPLYEQSRTAMTVPPKNILIGSTTVSVDVADTEALREQGLSGRTYLSEGHGMLFVFDTDGTWQMWMKDMRFPIDMLWVDASGTVVAVAPEVSPDTYPKPFSSAAPARYVIELPSGFAARHGIAEGAKVVI